VRWQIYCYFLFSARSVTARAPVRGASSKNDLFLPQVCAACIFRRWFSRNKLCAWHHRVMNGMGFPNSRNPFKQWLIAFLFCDHLHTFYICMLTNCLTHIHYAQTVKYDCYIESLKACLCTLYVGVKTTDGFILNSIN
jgi:hypothetical protein